MTQRAFWIGIACLYGIGLAVALSIATSQHSTRPGGWLALLSIPLLWGAGPIALTFVWLALKRWDFHAAKFGLLVFAGLYLVMVFIRWGWQRLL